ncbi:hypothetical protein B484DRAFT_406295, partial [Ochromonadaceae sp. CCMP2298]
LQPSGEQQHQRRPLRSVPYSPTAERLRCPYKAALNLLQYPMSSSEAQMCAHLLGCRRSVLLGRLAREVIEGN